MKHLDFSDATTWSGSGFDELGNFTFTEVEFAATTKFSVTYTTDWFGCRWAGKVEREGRR